MLIHEVTLKEAGPMAPAVAQNVAKLKQQRLARATPAVQSAQPAQPAQPSSGANVFGQMAQQLAPQTPAVTAGPTVSSTKGTITPTATGLVHTASDRNPNPRAPQTLQQKWDTEYRKLQNQFPGKSDAEYQQAMQSRTGTAQRPGGVAPAPTTVSRPTTPPAPPAPTTVSRPTTPPAPSTPVATPKARPATPVSTPAPTTQYPPITLGSGPKAQVFVNKGRGYIDSKTGKPMPPSIVKAMGV